MLLKRQDFILIFLFYAIYFGVYHYVMDYLYSAPQYISDKYLSCDCFAGCRLKPLYKLPFQISQVLLCLYIVLKYIRKDGILAMMLFPVLLWINYYIIFSLVYLLAGWFIFDISLGPAIVDILIGVLDYIATLWLFNKLKGRVKNIFSGFKKEAQT